MVTLMLRASGYRVITATAPEKALDMVQNGGCHIDVLVSDVFMPGMSGPELAQRLRIQRPELPVVLMSGNVENRPRDYPMIEKPFGIAQLQEFVVRALRR
jgi:CheY-like chemotaxis protein